MNTSSAPPRHRELEEAILADPDSPDAYLVYGDWLQEKGEPLGELVSVQAARAIDPTSSELAKHEKTLLAAHARGWLGYFAKYQHTWRFGFLESLIINEATREDIVELRDLVAARFLRELQVEVQGHRSFENSELISGLTELGMPPILRKLTLDSSNARGVDVGSLRSLWPRLSPSGGGRVKELVLRAGNAGFSEIDLPEIETLSLVTNAKPEMFTALTNAKWPKLVSMSLELTAYRYERVPLARIEPLVHALAEQESAGGKPTLRHLRLATHWCGDDMIELLSSSKLLRSLSTLSIVRGAIGDPGAQRLIADVKKFAHLESLDLSENEIPKPACEALVKAFAATTVKLKLDTQGANPGYEEPEEGVDYQDPSGGALDVSAGMRGTTEVVDDDGSS